MKHINKCSLLGINRIVRGRYMYMSWPLGVRVITESEKQITEGEKQNIFSLHGNNYMGRPFQGNVYIPAHLV